MTMLTVALAGALAVLFWQDSMRAREQAIAACRRACRDAGAQLLDETVALDGLRPVRGHGRLVLERHYRFEFSLAGDDRHAGWVRLAGRRIVGLQMDYPEGRTLLLPPDS